MRGNATITNKTNREIFGKSLVNNFGFINILEKQHKTVR